jgi:hypothetical protein
MRELWMGSGIPASTTTRRTALGAVAGLLVACGDPASPGPLDVRLAADGAAVAPDATITMTVTATNTSSAEVVWGQGSSTCQLGAEVLVGGTWRPMRAIRGCSRDAAPHRLGPGEARTETWPWRGEVIVGGSVEPLPPGRYAVRGRAGAVAASPAVTMAVAAPGDGPPHDAAVAR